MSKVSYKGPSSSAIWGYNRRKLTSANYGGGDGHVNVNGARNTLANGAQYTPALTGILNFYASDTNCNLEISGDGTNWDGGNMGADIREGVAVYTGRVRLNNDTGAGITYAVCGWKWV